MAEFLMFLGDVLLTAALVILAFNLLVLVIAWFLERRLERDLNEIAEEVAQEKLIALTVEIDGDQYLCYNAQTQAFVCQGRDLAEIRERFRERYPRKNAAIYNGDESAVAVLKQQLKEFHENSSGIGSTS